MPHTMTSSRQVHHHDASDQHQHHYHHQGVGSGGISQQVHDDVWMEELFMMDAGLDGAVGDFPCFEEDDILPVPYPTRVSSSSPRPTEVQSDQGQGQASKTMAHVEQLRRAAFDPPSCSSPLTTQACVISPDGSPRPSVMQQHTREVIAPQAVRQFSHQAMMSAIAPPPLTNIVSSSNTVTMTRCVSRPQQSLLTMSHNQYAPQQAPVSPTLPHVRPTGVAHSVGQGQPMLGCVDYVDYANVPEQYQATPAEDRVSCNGGVQRPFPERLHDMLTESSTRGLTDIVNWAPHGRCFVVRKPKVFQEEVLCLYFNQTKYRSFQRQLNLYGFKRITGGCDRGGYYHPLMLRGRRKLSTRMRRLKAGAKGAPSPHTVAEPDMEPNFYAMTPVGDPTRLAQVQEPSQTSCPPSPIQSSMMVPPLVSTPKSPQGSAGLKSLNLSHASPLTAALYGK